MNNRNIVAQVFFFIIYLALQILIVRNLVLFNMAFCYVYIAFIILLPFEINRLLLMLIAFGTGFITDLFYDTLGIHTAACVFTAYMRPVVIGILTPRGGYDAGMQPTVREMGLEWFIIYGAVIILLHHFALFFLEAGGFNLFLFTLGKVVLSALFSLICIILLQYLFIRPKRS
jgi:hypothetical protein